MKNTLCLISIFCLLIFGAQAQTIGVDNGGDGTWDDTNTYTSANIPDLVTENVAFSNNVGQVEIESGQSYTTGQIATGNGNTILVNGSLDVGDGSNPKNYVSGNSGTLTVNGTVVIWGNLNVQNNYILNVTGTLIIMGSVVMNNGGLLTINGDVDIKGDFTGGTNTNINVNGTLNVDGNIDTDNGSTLTGTGSVTSGSCSGDPDVCNDSQLPIALIAFKALDNGNNIIVVWSTATEENNDYFTIERSTDGLNYHLIATISGAGNSTEELEYSFTDRNPLFGKSYYRLKQTDFDGTSETFPPVSIDFTSLSEGELNFTNPVHPGDEVTVYTNTDEREELKLAVFDMTGQKIVDEKFTGVSYSFELSADVKPGIYYIKLSTTNSEKTGRLVVQ